MQPVSVAYGIAQVRSNNDPASVAEAVSAAMRVQFDEPLSESLLQAIADALDGYPDVPLRIYGRSVNPTMDFLRFFSRIRRLFVELWYAESFEPIGNVQNLVELGLGETKSRRPSIAVVERLPNLETLWIEGHG